MSENINEQIADLEAQVAAAEQAISGQNNETPTAETKEPAVPTQQEAPVQTNDDMVQRMVEQRVAAELAGIKAKLDEAYKARDNAVKEKVVLEDAKRQAEIKRMEDEGRHKEVAELKMAELQAKLETLQKENTRLSRDHAVTDALRGLDFRSDVAGEMAHDRILSQLVQDENGAWKHSSGVSIKEFVDHFTKDDSNSFLFKAKTNSGAGTNTFTPATDAKMDKKITEMSTEEMLKHFSAMAPQGGGTGNW